MKSNETVKIFVLYLMENVGYPLDYLTVSDMILQTDYVIYLDFAEAFADLQDSGMVKEVGKNSHGEPMYAVTEKGSPRRRSAFFGLPQARCQHQVAHRGGRRWALLVHLYDVGKGHRHYGG